MKDHIFWIEGAITWSCQSHSVPQWHWSFLARFSSWSCWRALSHELNFAFPCLNCYPLPRFSSDLSSRHFRRFHRRGNAWSRDFWTLLNHFCTQNWLHFPSLWQSAIAWAYGINLQHQHLIDQLLWKTCPYWIVVQQAAWTKLES